MHSSFAKLAVLPTQLHLLQWNFLLRNLSCALGVLDCMCVIIGVCKCMCFYTYAHASQKVSEIIYCPFTSPTGGFCDIPCLFNLPQWKQKGFFITTEDYIILMYAAILLSLKCKVFIVITSVPWRIFKISSFIVVFLYAGRPRRRRRWQ